MTEKSSFAEASPAMPDTIPVAVRFWVSQPPDFVWPLLHDISRIADCLPGMELLDVMADEAGFAGNLHLKPAQANLEFTGDALYVQRDDTRMTACVHLNGYEVAGGGICQLIVTWSAKPELEGTEVAVDIDYTLIGPIADYAGSADKIEFNTQAYIEEFSRKFQAFIDRCTLVASAHEELETTHVIRVGSQPVFSVGRLWRWMGKDSEHSR